MKKLIPLILICSVMLMITSCNEKSSLEENYIEKYNGKIIKTETLKSIKKTFNIQIPEQLNEIQLKEIATQIKRENTKYEQLFIFYFLPDTNVAWATTHYNINLEINIHGADKDEEKAMKSLDLPTGNILGKWFDNSPYIERSIIIYEDNDIYKMKVKYKDGSVGEEDLRKSNKNGLIQFDYNNDFGEYLLIQKNDKLALYGKNGLISVSNKIK